MCIRATLARFVGRFGQSSAHSERSAPEWRQDSFRQFMNVLAARYALARAHLSKPDAEQNKYIIEDIEKILRAWREVETTDPDTAQRPLGRVSDTDTPKAETTAVAKSETAAPSASTSATGVSDA